AYAGARRAMWRIRKRDPLELVLEAQRQDSGWGRCAIPRGCRARSLACILSICHIVAMIVCIVLTPFTSVLQPPLAPVPPKTNLTPLNGDSDDGGVDDPFLSAFSLGILSVFSMLPACKIGIESSAGKACKPATSSKVPCRRFHCGLPEN